MEYIFRDLILPAVFILAALMKNHGMNMTHGMTLSSLTRHTTYMRIKHLAQHPTVLIFNAVSRGFAY